MNFNNLETQLIDEYEVEREVIRFLEWTDTCFSRFKNKCSKEDFQRSRILKKVREEVWPLRVFLKNNLDVFHTVQLFGESQPYDAIGKKHSHLSYIEITCVKDGQFDLFQAQHMDLFGHAPASGIRKEDFLQANISGEASVGDCTYPRDEVRKAFEGVKVRLLDKNNKKYEPETILIVGVDSSSFSEIKYWNEFCELLSHFKDPLQFSNIFCVCTYTDRFFKIR